MCLSNHKETTFPERLPLEIILQKTFSVFKKERSFSVPKEKIQPLFRLQETRSLCPKLSP